MRKSWVEKLKDSKGLPVIKEITGKMAEKWGKGTMVIPAPMEVDEVIRRVPEGKLITIDGIRKVLAQKHNATICCPLTTGIFTWIAANAAEEEKRHGIADITPLLAHPQRQGGNKREVPRRSGDAEEASRRRGSSSDPERWEIHRRRLREIAYVLFLEAFFLRASHPI
ncbi:MAG: hypothetical protein QW176_08385 [Candidatus Bathyarchaeia archaeon]